MPNIPPASPAFRSATEIGSSRFSRINSPPTASGSTIGLLRVFAGGHGTGSSQGTLSAGQPVPTSYVATITNDKRVDDVRMVFSGGNLKDYTVEPPLGPHPDRIPVTDADRRNVLDPMTSTLDPVSGSGDPVSPQACDRKVSVFDGRLRFDLRSEFKRMEMVKAEKGYQGPVVVCAVYFIPVSGYIPDRSRSDIWPRCATPRCGWRRFPARAMLVPFRFSLPTPIGTGVLQATRFDSVANPPRAAANVKAQ